MRPNLDRDKYEYDSFSDMCPRTDGSCCGDPGECEVWIRTLKGTVNKGEVSEGPMWIWSHEMHKWEGE